MYDTLWGVIQSGDYDLPDMAHKIDVFYAEGKLTDSQRADLLEQVLAHADPGRERPEVPEMIQALADRMVDLAERVTALEQGTHTGGGDEPVTYPEWHAWDGISRDYQQGAVVRYNGKLWRSVFAGQNTWPPDTVSGIPLWEEVTTND